MPTSSDSAVSAFSPPESSSTFCSFLPGGEATTSMPLSALFSSSVSRMKAWPPPNSFVKVSWKFSLILWNASSNFCREIGIDLLDRRLRVLDRVEQVFALRLEEVVTLRRLLVLFQRHHVDRTHGVEPRAHLAVTWSSVASCSPVDRCDGRVGHQFLAFNAEIVQAGLRHVLRVRLQLRRRRRKFTTAITGLIRACRAMPQHFSISAKPRANLLGLELQQPFAGLAGVALRRQVRRVARRAARSRSPLHLLRRGARSVLQRVNALAAFPRLCDSMRCSTLPPIDGALPSPATRATSAKSLRGRVARAPQGGESRSPERRSICCFEFGAPLQSEVAISPCRATTSLAARCVRAASRSVPRG